MRRGYWQHIHVEKSPGNPLKGCSWVELLVNDIERFNVPQNTPAAYVKLTFEQRQVARTPGLPSRGNSGTKRFTLIINGESVPLGSGVVQNRARQGNTLSRGQIPSGHI